MEFFLITLRALNVFIRKVSSDDPFFWLDTLVEDFEFLQLKGPVLQEQRTVEAQNIQKFLTYAAASKSGPVTTDRLVVDNYATNYWVLERFPKEKDRIPCWNERIRQALTSVMKHPSKWMDGYFFFYI